MATSRSNIDHARASTAWDFFPRYWDLRTELGFREFAVKRFDLGILGILDTHENKQKLPKYGVFSDFLCMLLALSHSG